TVALAVVRDTGMTASFSSRPAGAAPGGPDSATYCSPSRLDCAISAIAFAGRRTLPLTSIVTFAVQLRGGRKIRVTRPTATLFTMTADCGTRSATSVNWAVTW